MLRTESILFHLNSVGTISIPAIREHKEVLPDGCISIARKPDRDIIRRMIAAVYVLHTQCVIHRNIRIEHFHVDPSGTVILSNFEHAIFTQMNRSIACVSGGTFKIPTWGPPCYDIDQYYGTEYDIWCLGLCIMQIMYPDIKLDITKIDKSSWNDHIGTICSKQSFDGDYGYRIMLRGMLLISTSTRFVTYALKNMSDIPSPWMWRQRTIMPFCSDTLPKLYIDWLPLILSDPIAYNEKIINNVTCKYPKPHVTFECRMVQLIISWSSPMILGEKWSPKWIYVAALISICLTHDITDRYIQLLKYRNIFSTDIMADIDYYMRRIFEVSRDTGDAPLYPPQNPYEISLIKEYVD